MKIVRVAVCAWLIKPCYTMFTAVSGLHQRQHVFTRTNTALECVPEPDPVLTKCSAPPRENRIFPSSVSLRLCAEGVALKQEWKKRMKRSVAAELSAGEENKLEVLA